MVPAHVLYAPLVTTLVFRPLLALDVLLGSTPQGLEQPVAFRVLLGVTAQVQAQILAA